MVFFTCQAISELGVSKNQNYNNCYFTSVIYCVGIIFKCYILALDYDETELNLLVQVFLENFRVIAKIMVSGVTNHRYFLLS